MGLVLDTSVNEVERPAALPVIHLISSGGFYGAERMLQDHCLAMQGRHQVVFLDAPMGLIERFRQAGVDCLACRSLGALLHHVRQRRSEQPLINTHNFKGMIYGCIAATLFGLPLVTTQHGFTPRSPKQRFYTWVSLQLCRLPPVRQVVCVADSIERIHRAAGIRQDKLQVIPNGLPEPTALPAGDRTEAPRIGYVGRLSAEKGPDLFLDALIPLCQRHLDWSAVLLGDGAEREHLQARIDAAGLAERIRLPGYQQDMPAWLGRLSALVISSRTEGTPMVLLEAMQARIPVAAFAVGGIPDMLSHGHDGLLATPGDTASLAEQVERLICEPGLAERLSAQAHSTQRSRYHLPRLAERWAQLYYRARGLTG
ncbi:glycosyl transferase family 1 [Stutzerimonas stutzeri]|uniref:Glycosyl transferase family 1 n=1 Tax=Stutzerimonas stutzeri TaxID=316 RepID=W8R376_STUST|nr:glycosyltransferase family 4 protein [Stutzerimonas stutzeri]AHL77380.1 glycosyl transferase family 1 [Stutzerimonas stutzeri]MCQ4330275.1 glycosyltransferase family 4 protein [Stutzerimonas stutzeri]